MCLAHQLDTQRAEQFSQKLIDVLNMGSLAIMTSIGHRTGLFDVLSTLPASTSTEIASAAGLNERYVREWLGTMATGGIVECFPNGSITRFSLPPEHAAFLTTAAAEDNIALFTQYIPLLSSVEDKIIDCFKHGGGVPYEEFGRFHEVMAEDSGQSVRSSLIQSIIPLVSGLHDDLTRGIEVLDIGCGMGRALNLMANFYPKSRFTGYDLCQEPINIARKEAAEQGLRNVTFEVRDLTTFDVESPGTAFDLITAFDAIHDQAQPDRVLAGVHHALKADGTFLMQDIAGSSKVEKNIDHPIGTFLYTISCMHCMTVSLAQDGMGLGAMWGEEKAKEMLKKSGFTSVVVKKLEHDFQNSYYIVQKK
jgi:2-polyprenyl-3-methyl-5-hydroxy-6-metoxy-1,4-benzoquinol methylase